MIQLFKKFLKNTPIYPFLLRFQWERKKRKIINGWKKMGNPIPPPHLIKQETVKEYAQKFSTQILIESGTYLGDMVFAMKDVFNQIYSVELDSDLYMKTKERFANAQNIHIIQGDSSKALPDLLSLIKQPCLFWLDGHYSGGITTKGALNTPILEEVKYIFAHAVKDHIILIDDARHFIGQKDYPTIEHLKELVAKERPSWVFEVKDDIIRISKFTLGYPIKINNFEGFKRKILDRISMKVILFSNKIILFIVNKEFRIAIKLWFRKQGNKNLRVNYELNQNSIVIDAGGYQGDWAFQIYNKYKCNIFIFEPIKSYYRKISERFAGVGKIQNINFGLGDCDIERHISVTKDSSSFYKKEATSSSEPCRIMSVKRFMLERDLKHVDLIKINIEGGEYDLLDKLLDSGLINQFGNLQIQFHKFIPNAFLRRRKIRRILSKTHYLTYNYPFVWENWRKK